MPPVARKIMIIRHAEKPDPSHGGVKESGEASKHDLIVRGWQRAGALGCFFAPTHGPLQDPRLAVPGFLFASRPPEGAADDASKSHRPEETITPLAQKLGNITINTDYLKGQEPAVAAAALACNGVVLISWQHESIYKITNAIPASPAPPQDWPDDRFDVVYTFTLNPDSGTYTFDQVPQCLLAGDLPTGIE